MSVDHKSTQLTCNSQAAQTLSAESGFQLAIPAANDFEAAILGGRWAEGIALLPKLGVDMAAQSTSQSTPRPSRQPSLRIKRSAQFSSEPNLAKLLESAGDVLPQQQARFLISQQKYLEYLERGDQKKALHTLRSELAPTAKDSDLLHSLSGYVHDL
jgi:hypothetical protein